MNNIQGNSLNTVNWQGLLDKLVETSGVNGAAKISTKNHTLVLNAEVNGATTTITVNIPDDLPLPDEVDEAAIESLINKLSGLNASLTADEIQALKDQLTTIYNEMAGALDEVTRTSTGSVMFDLYKLMALLVDVAQSQRDAARELRTTQSAQIQNSIQSQADMQRDAAMVGLIVGVVCGAASVIVSCVMVGLQGAAYKNQVSAARASGTDVAQTNAKMLKGADTVDHANAQLAKVEKQVGTTTATQVKDTMNGQIQQKGDAFTAKKQELHEAQTAFDGAQREFDTASANCDAKQATLRDAQRANTAARLEADIPGGKTAAQAKADYLQECQASQSAPDQQRIAKYDNAIRAENEMNTAQSAHAQAKQELTAKETTLNGARKTLTEVKGKFEEARSEYRSAIDESVKAYTETYESTVAAEGSNSKAATKARNEMRMAMAYADSKLAQEGVTTKAEYRAAITGAKDGVERANQQLNANDDYRHALHRIERYTGINAINTALGNMFQGMTQNISGMMSAEATRLGSEQEQERDQLDQTKDLFDQAQGLVDAVVQLMQAVASAESQSMRDAIQA